MSTYLLIDSGYFNFFRYFAAKSWYKKAKEYTDDETMSNDPQFQTTLVKRVEESVAKILKQHQIPWEKVVFARDCKQSDIWRNHNIQGYKATRDQTLNVKVGFTTITQKINQLVENKGCRVISHPTLEADDLVYLYRRFILEQIDPEAKFVVITSDIDYYQICYPNTKLQRLDKRDPMTKSSGDPERDLLLKIITGDKSDNIPSIIPKCGPKTAQKYLDDPDLLSQLLADNDQALINFNNNRKVIDFRQIPEELQKQVITHLSNTHTSSILITTK